MNEDTIIVGSLEKDELERSINELVAFVEGKTNKMAEDFTQGLDKMKLAMKDFAVTQKVSVDLMKEAWRSMSSSFDAMVAAESTHGGGRGRGSKPTYDDDTVGALRESVKLEKKLREERKLGSPELQKQNRLIEELQKQLKQETTSQKSLNDVIKMQANSIEEVNKKMAALKKVQIDPQNALQVKKLGDEYQKLSRLQATLLGKNMQLTHSNNYLAQSFGYIRNRIVYALTLGAMTNFVKQIYEVRGQYELLERSLGILIDDMDRGTEIFNELNEMALKSPFTLTELATGAKQLVAYNFAENEVVDTTRRLADISAALGVPMERLVYNLGQIRAQTVLNARDARDFANAGLAIVPMLAQLYTEQKRFGDQVVTTAQVYDMMSKKMVSYGDVMQVINKITDEGGKFYDFQAKQAETLRVQINNLTLAFNNMLNDIGKEQQSVLTVPLRGLKLLFENWRQVSRVIMTVITTLGIYKTVSATVEALNSRMFVGRILVNLRNYINGIRAASGAMATFNAVTKLNAVGFLASALAAVVGYFAFFKSNVEETTVEMERFGESGAKALKKIDTLSKILQGTNETSSTYKKTLSELSQITSEYGVELDVEKARREDVNKAIEQTIELIKQESAERQRANQLEKAREEYDTKMENARKRLNEVFSGGFSVSGGGADASYIKGLKDNAGAVSAIIEEIVTSNIGTIINKSGDELDKGIGEIYKRIDQRLERIGIRGGNIEQILGKGFLTSTSAVEQFATAAKQANETLDRRGKIIDKNKKLADEETQATMTFTEKVNANSRALQKNSNDALSLYNNIYEIVEIAKKNHVINFDLKLTAQEPPKWMFDKSLPELQQLAQRFAAIAKSGGVAIGYDKEGTYERALQYAAAARKKQEDEERKAREKNKKTRNHQRKDEDVIAEALKQELSLIKEIQSNYAKLRKAGVDNTNAINIATKGYETTLERVNNVLSKYGINKFNASDFAGKNVHDLLDTLTRQRDALIASGKAKTSSLKDLDVEIQKLTIDAKTYDMKKITDGLNNELGKLKDEYELGIELDANPELGDVFADMMGISDEQLESLPKDFESVARRLQSIIDTQLGVGKFNLMENLNKATLDNWIKQNQHGTAQDDEMTKVLTAYVDYANKVRLDETKKQTDEWNKLLEKYSEYEYKITQIRQQAERERETARKKNAPQGVFDAINLREQRELAKLNFEEFQKSPEWIVATGDLAGLTDKALGSLIKSLEEYKKKAKNLDPKQIKNLNNALKNLRKQQREGNPFLQIANALDDAKTRAELFQPEMDAIMSDIIALENEIGNNKPTKEQAKQLNNLKKMWKDLAAQGDVSATQIVEGINASIAAASQAITMFTDMADALGGEHMTEASENIKRVVGVIEKAGQGAAIGAQIGGGYGAIIGAVAGGLSGLITNFADQWSGNRSITKRVQESERAVKRLEIAYVDLQHAMDNAYGTNIVGAKKAAQANKELQLQELQRQLLLEKSRESKNRDEDKILDLQKAIKELQYEITDMTTEIVNDLMGISSVGDFAENLVESMIEAFRQGEDYMKVFEGKFEEMIDNMIMKSIVSRVMTQYMDNLWSALDERITARSNQEADDYAKAHAENIELKNLSDDEILNRMGYDWRDIITLRNINKAKYDKLVADYKKAASDAETSTKQALDTVSAINDSDISWVMEQLGQTTPELAERLKELISQYYSFGDKANGGDNLSGLQQGIQSVTEETAGALEAYMNSVSQQVYLHSDLLTQIRDAVVGFDLDVQLGVLSQMLLQLQQSYQTHQAIQQILEGVLTPSGRAFNVELLS